MDDENSESFSFTTIYEGDTDVYFAKRTKDGYSVTVKYRHCEATVDFTYREVADKLAEGEWKFKD
jgi:hypothetical protein